MPHSEKITQAVEMISSLDLKSKHSTNKKQTDIGNKSKINISLLGATITDWASQVARIRKNHNIVDKRRSKKVKRPEIASKALP